MDDDGLVQLEVGAVAAPSMLTLALVSGRGGELDARAEGHLATGVLADEHEIQETAIISFGLGPHRPSGIIAEGVGDDVAELLAVGLFVGNALEVVSEHGEIKLPHNGGHQGRNVDLIAVHGHFLKGGVFVEDEPANETPDRSDLKVRIFSLRTVSTYNKLIQ